MFKSTLATALLGITLFASASIAKDDSHKFLRKAAQSNMSEVSMARIALQKASNNEITDFAKMMIEDHTGANGKVMSLAKDKKVTLPDTLTRKQTDGEMALSKLNDRGREFDRKYMALNVEAHQKAVAAFEKQAKSGTDADVRAFAANTLPTLKKHLDMAVSLNSKLNMKSNNN